MRREGGPSPAVDAVGGLAVGLSAVQFGAAVVLGKVAGGGGLPIWSMLAVRFLLSSAVLAVGLLAAGRTIRAARGEGWLLLALGGVGYGAEAALFFGALQHGTAAAVTLLFFTFPAWVTLLWAALGRGLPGVLVGSSLVAAMSGAALVVASSGGLEISAVGVGLALGAAVTSAVYLVAVDAVLRRTSSPAASLRVTAGAGLSLGVVALMLGARLPSGAAEWGPVLAMAVFTIGAYLGLFIGLRRLGPVRTSIISSLEPVATAVLGYLVLQEAVRPLTGVGGALILAGSVAASLARRPTAPGELP